MTSRLSEQYHVRMWACTEPCTIIRKDAGQLIIGNTHHSFIQQFFIKSKMIIMTTVSSLLPCGPVEPLLVAVPCGPVPPLMVAVPSGPVAIVPIAVSSGPVAMVPVAVPNGPVAMVPVAVPDGPVLVIRFRIFSISFLLS